MRQVEFKVSREKPVSRIYENKPQREDRAEVIMWVSRTFRINELIQRDCVRKGYKAKDGVWARGTGERELKV